MAEPRASVEEHLDRVLAATSATPATPASPATIVGLGAAEGRVLADDVTAALAVPRFDHAAMDGFAVRSADVAGAAASAPVVLPVADVVAAGESGGTLPPGAAVRIMTGAPLPPGADLVVPFEWTDRGDPVGIERDAPAGRHIRRAGEDVAAGSVVLRRGTALRPAQLGLLAAVGRAEVPVRPRPRVAVLATGKEIGRVADGDPAAAVPDSNTVTLVAAARAAGADAVGLAPVTDDESAFRERLAAAAASADLVVTTGGISAGDHDVVKAALRGTGDFWFGSVPVKPGRPQGVGTVATADGRRVPVLTLPGTPVAAYSTFLLFAVPAIRSLAGLPPGPRPCAPLAVPVRAADRTVLLPGTYDADGSIAPLPGHVGHSQRLLAAADALLVVPPRPPEAGPLPAGALVEVLDAGRPAR